MGKFALGLIVGIITGAAAMVLVYEQPWQRGETEEPEAIATPDAGPSGKGKKRRRGRKRRGRGTGTGQPQGTEVVELTASDRMSIWRGQPVKLPPKDMDFGGTSGRPLDQSEINAGIRGGTDAIADCIGQARGNAELTAEITLKMLVDGNGRVTAKRIKAPRYLQDNGLLRCTSGAISRMSFPATGAHTVVTVPFTLD